MLNEIYWTGITYFEKNLIPSYSLEGAYQEGSHELSQFHDKTLQRQNTCVSNLSDINDNIGSSSDIFVTNDISLNDVDSVLQERHAHMNNFQPSNTVDQSECRCNADVTCDQMTTPKKFTRMISMKELELEVRRESKITI